MLTPSYKNSVLLSTSQVLAFEISASTIAVIEGRKVLEAQTLNKENIYTYRVIDINRKVGIETEKQFQCFSLK